MLPADDPANQQPKVKRPQANNKQQWYVGPLVVDDLFPI
jgi:hypothetical protein